jgi:hypothetical protein
MPRERCTCTRCVEPYDVTGTNRSDLAPAGGVGGFRGLGSHAKTAGLRMKVMHQK